MTIDPTPPTSPRISLIGPLGLPPQPSRSATPPTPRPEDIAAVLPPKPTPAAAAAAEIVGFTLPPVERIVASVQDAQDTVARLQATIRAVLSTGLATADAIQGRLSGQILSQIQSALQTAQQVCDGVHECVVAQALATIGTVDQWMMTLGLPDSIQTDILSELGAIFGTAAQGLPTAAPSGTAAYPPAPPDEVVRSAGGIPIPPECPPGECRIDPLGSCEPCPPGTGGGGPPPPIVGGGPPSPGLPPAPGVSYSSYTCPDGTVRYWANRGGWVYSQPGVQCPPGTVYTDGGTMTGGTWVCLVPDCSPPLEWMLDPLTGQNGGCSSPYLCGGGGGGGPPPHRRHPYHPRRLLVHA